MALKTHLAISGQNSFGGSFTGTLCGRENSRVEFDNLPDYSTEARSEVTCAHCLNIISNPKNWRHRKYLAAA